MIDDATWDVGHMESVAFEDERVEFRHGLGYFQDLEGFLLHLPFIDPELGQVDEVEEHRENPDKRTVSGCERRYGGDAILVAEVNSMLDELEKLRSEWTRPQVKTVRIVRD